jgi:hypothetical protein
MARSNWLWPFPAPSWATRRFSSTPFQRRASVYTFSSTPTPLDRCSDPFAWLRLGPMRLGLHPSPLGHNPEGSSQCLQVPTAFVSLFAASQSWSDHTAAAWPGLARCWTFISKILPTADPRFAASSSLSRGALPSRFPHCPLPPRIMVRQAAP